VQATVFGGIAMRLVASVDDGTFESGFQSDFLFEEVRSLTELIRDVTRNGAGRFAADLSRSGEHLSRDKMRSDLGDQSSEWHRSVDEKVFVTAVTVALSIAVVLVDDDFATVGQHRPGACHAAPHDFLGRPVVKDHLARGSTLGGRAFWMRMVDVIAGTIGEDGVDQMGLHLGREYFSQQQTPSVVPGLFVEEVPGSSRFGPTEKCVDQHRAGGDRIQIGVAHDDAVLGFNAAHLGDCHGYRY
ncbi:MAG: hypothetical protein RLZ74_1049, partial [Actinomycetota bacterium]